MGAAVAFDRSEVIRLLEARGFEHDKATGIADVIRDHVLPYAASKRGESSARGRLASRLDGFQADLTSIRIDLAGVKGELMALEARLVKQMSDSKWDLIKWLVPIMIGQAAAIAALVKLL